MKKRVAIFVLLIAGIVVYSQPLPDSILTKYNSATTQRNKSSILVNYLQGKQFIKDSIKGLIALQQWFKAQQDETGVDILQLSLASSINRSGDYTTALAMCLPVLASFEKRKDTIGIISAFRKISICYEFAYNFEQAVFWCKKAIPYVIALNDEQELSNSYNDIGATYAKANMPDSGIVYAQLAVNIDLRMNNEINLPFSLSTLAENYIASKNYDLAVPFLNKSLSYALKSNNPWAIGFTQMDLAQAYQGLKNYDSAVHYAQQSIKLAVPNSLQEIMLKSYTVICEVYEATNKQDSANKYFRLAAITKDSLYTIEKLNYAQTISFREQLKEQEIAAEKEKAEAERKNNIQYIGIAIGILLFIILFLLLSRSIIVNEKVISFLGILGLLVVFEFINLIFHPLIASLTHHSPVWMLVILVGIASLLIPLHHKLEHWIKHKMVEKNKNIRLAAAKKTIEQLENKKES